jgi:putative membrane protein
VNPRKTLLRVAAPLGVAAVLTGMATAPAVAADGDVDVLNTETVQIYTSPTGEVETQRVYEQLAMTGTGSVDVSNPISTDGLRNLDGFGGFDVEGGEQVTHMTVDGEKHLRTVSNFTGDLPLDVSVSYKLDGKTVEPGDVVGESGELEVLYMVKNITAEPRELSFPDGSGGTTTETVDVPIPMVGSLTTVAPENFTNVKSKQANMAGDGQGGTKLSFTMTLFPPIGSDTAEFGYTADIVDGVVPEADVSALPVNPLESPTFASAADSYQGGTETGAKLAEGAATIDSNLLKLRDGASELLAGLIKLHEGSAKLQAGLADEAAPGAEKLSDGAGQLDDGLGKIADGAGRLFDGTGRLVAGTGDLTDGTGRLADGANRLSDGAGRLSNGAGRLSSGAGRLSAGAGEAYTGSQQLTDGLHQISGGLGQLADGQSGLPAAKDGIKQLQGGVDLILAGFGTTSDPATLIGGLNKLELGLGELEVGAQNLAGGLSGQLRPGLGAAKGGVDQVQAGLADAVRPGGNLDQLLGGLSSLEAFCDADEPACLPTITALKNGASTSKANLTAANQGLLAVSGGLSTAIGGMDNQLIPGANQIAGGLTQAKGGAGTAKGGAIKLKEGVLQVDGGLTQLDGGISKAVAGVLALSTGADSAAVGSSDLTAGLRRLNAGAGDLADGAGRLDAGAGDLDAGAGKLADGTAELDAGANKLANGAGDLNAGTGKLADGTDKAADGSGKLAAGADKLAAGLDDAADGSGRLTDGLGQAREGAPKLVDGAQKLSDKGTSKLVEAGKDTTQTYGQMYATMQAGAERAQVEDMAYGAPEGAAGLTAYSYVIQGDDGETSRNLSRGLAGMALLGLGGGGLLLRRRLI